MTVLADATRHRVVGMLATGPLASGDIARRIDASAPPISQRLRTLRGAQFVCMPPLAQRRIYELNSAWLAEFTEWINRMRESWL